MIQVWRERKGWGVEDDLTYINDGQDAYAAFKAKFTRGPLYE